MEKIESLSVAQKAKFPEYIEKWIKIGLSTEKANRPEAEKGIIEAYKSAGLATPKIIWCDSPLSMAFTRAIVLQSGDKIKKEIGASVRDSVWDSVRDSVRDSVGDSVRASVRDSVWDSVRDSVRDSVGDSVRASVRDSVWDSVRASVRDSVWASVRDSVGDSVRASVRDSVGDSVRDSVWDSVWDSGYGQHDANWMGFYDYFRKELNLKKQTEKLQGLTAITQNAGWFLPHTGMCWISERQCVVLQDSNKRLHCENGPAVKYPDGWALHYWHGVKIPGWVVDQPEKITVDLIEKEDNAEIRRVMITKYGMAKYLEQSGAQEIDRDRDTKGERILYSKKDKMGVIKMIKLENSTPELDGSSKYYTFRCDPKVKTCQEAVAYLYSRDPKQYQPSVET